MQPKRGFTNIYQIFMVCPLRQSKTLRLNIIKYKDWKSKILGLKMQNKMM